MSDPTGGWADATGKTSEAVTEITKAGRDLGSFMAPLFRELLGVAIDSVQIWRSKRQVRLAEKFQAFLQERGLERPNREIPASFALPLIERASLEGDDDLQDIWARMLANAADAASGVEMRTAFVDMLSQMNTFDVRILAEIANASAEPAPEPKDIETGAPQAAFPLTPPLRSAGILTGALPDNAVMEERDGIGTPAQPREDVEIALANLVRLGCLLPTSTWDGLSFAKVTITLLGKAFVRACTTAV